MVYSQDKSGLIRLKIEVKNINTSKLFNSKFDNMKSMEEKIQIDNHNKNVRGNMLVMLSLLVIYCIKAVYS